MKILIEDHCIDWLLPHSDHTTGFHVRLIAYELIYFQAVVRKKYQVIKNTFELSKIIGPQEFWGHCEHICKSPTPPQPKFYPYLSGHYTDRM